MRIKNVLLTGGAGYVGAILVPKLLRKGYHVKIVDWYLYEKDVFNDYKDDPDLVEIKGDIRDEDLLRKELAGINTVIHLACVSNDPSFELDRELGRSVNYDATVKLVDISKKKGVERFIYASTSSVYGIKNERQVTEELPLEPLTDYSAYKALCEKYILSKQSDSFTVLVLRPATICGFSPRMRLDLTVNLLTIQALVNKKITVYGGKQKRPNIHIKDITDLYLATLGYPKEKIAGKIYNAGYENYTVAEIAKMVKRVLKNPSIEIITKPTDDRRSYHICSEKIRKELGFVPKHSIEEAILDIKRAYEKGKILEPLDNVRYYNIKTMKERQGCNS